MQLSMKYSLIVGGWLWYLYVCDSLVERDLHVY